MNSTSVWHNQFADLKILIYLKKYILKMKFFFNFFSPIQSKFENCSIKIKVWMLIKFLLLWINVWKIKIKKKKRQKEKKFDFWRVKKVIGTSFWSLKKRLLLIGLRPHLSRFNHMKFCEFKTSFLTLEILNLNEINIFQTFSLKIFFNFTSIWNILCFVFQVIDSNTLKKFFIFQSFQSYLIWK